MISTGSANRLYADKVPGYDEAIGRGGDVLEGWGPFLEAMERSGRETRGHWKETIQRDLREDGLTFTVAQDDLVTPRRDDLDPVPWILPANEWAELEKGIEQRARLLEAVVKDLLGPKRLIDRSLLPAELVYTDPAYLRPCVNLPSNMGASLFQYAVDMARGPDGRMWVLEDRTQAPSGAGYALESRTILGRIFPQWISQMNVRRLAPYFRGFRESLMRMYEGRRLEPRVVLLTPGPYSATYFEHAYLAAYLGYTLVQGDDLLVRNGGLKLKTLEGLQSVDIVLRRLDAEYLDPLELRRDSFLGVAGMLGAMRSHRVASINHPGCGLLENRGLLPFLPALCRELLGEDLKLPSAATWWCGQPREMKHVLANLDNLVIKPIQRVGKERSTYGWLCSTQELEALKQRILAHPERYVGQERIGFSTVPMLVGGELEPRASVLRAFAHADGDGYDVMPGALARSAVQPDSQRVSVQAGGVLKDVWVLGDAPEDHRSIWVQNQRERGNDWFTGVFTSRGAENLFWVGRYAERLSRQIRLLRGMIQLEDIKLDLEGPPSPELERMVDLLDKMCGRLSVPPEETVSDRLDAGLKGGDGIGSVKHNLRSLLMASYTVRDIWSQDTWRILTTMESVGEICFAEEVHPFSLGNELAVLIEKLNAFAGLNVCSMTRESGWTMLMLGRSLEAGIGVCELVTELLLRDADQDLEYTLMETALRQNENLITYRRHYRTTPQMQAVMDLILGSEINPRSLVYLLGQSTDTLHALPAPTDPNALEGPIFNLKKVRNDIQAAPWRDGNVTSVVKELLSVARLALEESSMAVSSAFFRHTSVRALEEY